MLGVLLQALTNRSPMPLTAHTRRLLVVFCASLLASAAARAEPAGLLQDVADAVSATELEAGVARMVGFGTRHTLSDTRSDTRGIGAARRWVQSRFMAVSKDCGACLEVVMPSQTVTGARVPQPTEVVDVVAIQRG